MSALLDEVLATLDRAGIGAALIGAAAMSTYGVARSTVDIDLLVVEPRALELSTWSSLRATVEIRRGDLLDPLAGVVRISRAKDRPLDIVVGNRAWQRQILARTQSVLLGATSVPTARLSDLVLLKLYAGGPQDAWDILQLLALDEPATVTEVDRQVDSLPRDAQELWGRLRAARR